MKGRRRSSRWLSFLGAIALACALFTQPALMSPAALAKTDSADTARCLRDPACHRTFVVAHRGYTRLTQWLAARPENSRVLVREAVAAGVPLIEVDIRLSKDGVPFVLHDTTLDRTTSCMGKIADMSAAELVGCRLTNGESVPRFEDIYEITRGHAVLDLDLKADAVDEIVDWLRSNGSFDDALFYVVRIPTIELAARAKHKIPQMLVMVRTTPARNDITIDRMFHELGSPSPEVIHIAYPFLRLFRASSPAPRFKTFCDSWVLPFLSIPWLRLAGVDLIESNDPVVVARFLHSDVAR